jgi:hypothetical protein
LEDDDKGITKEKLKKLALTFDFPFEEEILEEMVQLANNYNGD